MLSSLLAIWVLSTQAVTPPASPLIFNKPAIENNHVEAFKSILRAAGEENQRVAILGDHVNGLATFLEKHHIPAYGMSPEAFLFNAMFADMPVIGYHFGAVLLPEEMHHTRALAKELEKRVVKNGFVFVAYPTTGFDQSLIHRGFEKIKLTFRQFPISGPQDSWGTHFHIFQKKNGHLKNNHPPIPDMPPGQIHDSQIFAFKKLVDTTRGSGRVLVLGQHEGAVAVAAHQAGFQTAWLKYVSIFANTPLPETPMSAIILPEEVEQNCRLARAIAYTLEYGGLLFTPEWSHEFDNYLKNHGLDRTPLKLQKFMARGYYAIYRRVHGHPKALNGNGTIHGHNPTEASA